MIQRQSACGRDSARIRPLRAAQDPVRSRPYTYGMMYGMQKTTVYVPEELKRSLARAAAARGCSEAELIREALRAVTTHSAPPHPHLPLFRSGKPRLAERVDDALAGFGGS
jgi:ribbon-helix-helix CopG family protein